MPSSAALGRSFFDQDCRTLARALLGRRLVRETESGGRRVSGRVVEVESYLGGEDEASHSRRGRRTPRTEPMYMQPGTAYVYAIYGTYHCLNISSAEPGGAVLIRSLEPEEGLDAMLASREARRASAARQASVPKRAARLKHSELCNGPSKLCIALDIDKAQFDKADLCCCPRLYLEEGAAVAPEEVVQCRRVGIEGVPLPWRDAPLRYYVRGSSCVSVRDRAAEAVVATTQDGDSSFEGDATRGRLGEPALSHSSSVTSKKLKV